MKDLAGAIDRIAAETNFSGVVRVEAADDVAVDAAYGLASRTYDVANTVDTRFATASIAKGFTALSVVSLIDEGVLQLDTPARAILGADLPLINDDVTIEHLLSHRSGIGDYVDEDQEDEPEIYFLSVPFADLTSTADYLPALDGHETKFPAGERFSYCNGGFAVLAIIAERVSGVPFEELVRQRVCEPAGMPSTSFLRSDELPPVCATGYFTPDGLRSNIFALPLVGTGDGGIYTTLADLHTFWGALFGGRIVSAEWVTRMTSARSEVDHMRRYGLGFWLQATRDVVFLEGADAGVSAVTVHDPSATLTYSVLSNTSDGAWPLWRHLRETLTPETAA